MDPEAAAIVFETTECPTSLMPWDIISETGWASKDTKVMRFCKAVASHTTAFAKDILHILYCPPDIVTMALALNGKLCTESKLCYCYVDTCANPLTRGQLIVDWRGLLKRPVNITVCTKWSPEVFKEVLEKKKLC